MLQERQGWAGGLPEGPARCKCTGEEKSPLSQPWRACVRARVGERGQLRAKYEKKPLQPPVFPL